MKAELYRYAYRVVLEESDVERFASRWPCYGERRPLAFVFERSSGDLSDIEGEHADNDESGLTALSNDAATAGAELCGLVHVAALRRPYSDPETVAAFVLAGLVRLAILAGRIAEVTSEGATDKDFKPLHELARDKRIATQCAVARKLGLFGNDGRPRDEGGAIATRLWHGMATEAELTALL